MMDHRSPTRRALRHALLGFLVAGSALVIFERGHAFGRFLYGLLH